MEQQQAAIAKQQEDCTGDRAMQMEMVKNVSKMQTQLEDTYRRFTEGADRMDKLDTKIDTKMGAMHSDITEIKVGMVMPKTIRNIGIAVLTTLVSGLGLAIFRAFSDIGSGIGK